MWNKIQKIYIGENLVRVSLPSEYQRVKYIQTTWTQWIDTGVSLVGNTNIQVKTKVEVTTTSQNIPVFWNRNSSTVSYTSWNYYHLTPYASKWYFGKNNVEWNGGTYNPTIWTVYKIDYNNSNADLVVNGSVAANVSWTVGYTDTTLAISFRGNNNQYNKYFGQYKYFYFNVYDRSANKYVREFVPCYRKSDNVIWMYDLVGRQFYTNAGSWSFTKWPNA